MSKLHANNGSDMWMSRPLPDFLAKYAAMDIKRLSSIYDHFVEKGYLKPHGSLDPKLFQQSELYVQLFRYTGRQKSGDPYQHSNILPLGILDYSPSCTLEFLCVCCVRILEPCNFLKKAREKQHSGGYVCRRCIFLDLRRDK